VKPVLQTIEAIHTAITDEAPPGAVEETAARYARFCSEAEQRLDRVAAMLQKGSDYQALQVAEEELPLLDLAAALSFGEEKVWQTYCELHGLKVAPRLNARIIADLEALYAKGISANHPLYKDFRAAVLSRDDAKSLRIVKTILKLNPSDDNAKKELLRLENKGVQEKIDQLREALKSDDEERIATLTEAIKSAAPAAKLERLDVFHEGERIRKTLRKRQAEDRLPGMIAEMQALKADGRWRQVGLLLDASDSMTKEHGLEPAADEQNTAIEELRRYHQKEQAADEKQRNFDRALKSFLSFVEEVETRLLTGAGVTYAEIAEKDEVFVKRWKELEGYQLPVANESLQRLRAAGQELRARLERMQRAKRMRNMALAAAVLVLLSCISALGMHAWKAWTLTQELASYQTKESCGAAEDLIKKLRSDEELLLRWPYLQAKIAEVNSWTAQARITERQAKDALQALESSFQGDSTAHAASQLVRQLDDADALVQQLSGDLAAEPKNRLVALKTKSDLHLVTVLKKLTASTATTLSEIEKTGDEELSYAKPAAKVGTSRDAIDKLLQPLEALFKPEVAALTLPADLEARIQSQRQRLNTYQKELQSFAAVRAETAGAGTLDDYRKAVAKWQEVKFAEAAPSMKMLDTLPAEKAFQSALYTSGDQEELQAILDDKSGRHMAPDTPLEADIKTILTLQFDENLNTVFESTVAHYSRRKANSTVWSQGKPEQSVIGSLMKWTAKFYESDSSGMAVLFISKSFGRVGDTGGYQGEGVLSSRLSQTSEFMNQLEIARITDDKGERVMKSLLEVFDKLIRDEKGSPIAKAYVMLKLQDMLQLRPHEWGEHYCPSLQHDLRELRRILGTAGLRSEDWLVPEMREKWTKPLAEFFKTCKGRSYMREAVARRNYLRPAAAAGLKFAGYVEADLSLSLNQLGRAASELWVIGKDGGKPLLVANPAAGSAVTDTLKPIVVVSSVPLSPVFVVSVDRKTLVQKYHEELAATGIDLKPLPGESLFLTEP